MENQVKEKIEVKKANHGPVSMYLENIPRAVHNKILRYKNRITGERNKAFTVKQAYVEFLKDKA
jgi:hypothetical protein